ncbi:Imm43 family immunity protein [Hymenobacter cellulosivorans]|uniref:Imm43 family immunity protein n=1 Tax=Hymenobacter cellulosivorans TaxID=2932249 RepID=A0ABY4FG93_9BACT|nr:Imm43 family immunity protein [Hymenobacter cellulosivorans]UOQ55560.1 Imm43 family immunity protein [Hymenobacter cellulosivorans]
MTKVLIWYSQPAEQPKGVPARGNVTYTDDFNPKKPMYGADAPWLDYNHQLMPFPPPSKELKFPDHLFVVVKKHKEILFDFFSLDVNHKIISKNLLVFLQEYGLNEGYEIAKASIIDTKGNVISTKEYFVIRIARFDDKLLDFISDTKVESNTLRNHYLYKDIRIINSTKQQAFFSEKITYGESLLLSEYLKEKIIDNFYAATLLSPEEYVTAFDKPW